MLMFISFTYFIINASIKNFCTHYSIDIHFYIDQYKSGVNMILYYIGYNIYFMLSAKVIGICKFRIEFPCVSETVEL